MAMIVQIVFLCVSTPHMYVYINVLIYKLLLPERSVYCASSREDGHSDPGEWERRQSSVRANRSGG
jgi:hypothetical protein